MRVSFLFLVGRFDLSIEKVSQGIGHKTPFLEYPRAKNKNRLGKKPQAVNR
jgi:hypothetical protein